MKKVAIALAIAALGIGIFRSEKPQHPATPSQPLHVEDAWKMALEAQRAAGYSVVPASAPSGDWLILPPTVAPPRPIQRAYTDCTEDCSGHDAGYQWAEENDVQDAGDCSGNSQSFIEGCEQRAEDWQSENPE